MNLDKIPQELKDLPQWVCTRGDCKIPIDPLSGFNASSTDIDTWAVYNTAKNCVLTSKYDWLGFVFNDNGIVGVDIDDGYDDDGFLSSIATDIIGVCKSYTEKSKSGRGFHILLKGDIPFKGKNNLKGVEIYKQSRFFIMTGDVLLYDKIVENQDAIDYIVDKYFPETRETTDKKFVDRLYQPLWEQQEGRISLRPIYPKIPNGCRNVCLTSLAGMLHNQGYSYQQIYDELMYCNKTACEPMLPSGEVRNIVNSVRRYKR